MSVLVIDNYDSFVHNLARYFRVLGATTQVVRNDRVTLDEVAMMNPSHIVLSPGPCSPDEAGVCVELVQTFAGQIPILGVCLGHQAIAQAFGGRVVRAEEPMHGKPSVIQHDQTGPFAGLPHSLTVGRYHSLIVESASLPACLRVTAQLADGTIMALTHREWPVWGVQFHPESVLTEEGMSMVSRFYSTRI